MRSLIWLLAVFAAAAVLAVGARLDQGYVQCPGRSVRGDSYSWA